MKQLLFSIAVALGCIVPAAAQLDGNAYPDRFNKAVYLELGGSGLLYSLNYDMRLTRGRQDGMGFRVGIGGISARGSTNDDTAQAGYLAIPVTFNYLIGERRHALELGAGATLLDFNAHGNVDNDYFDADFTGPVPHANIGYRYQSLDNGFTGRLTYTPFIGDGIEHWIGISFGVNFK